MSFYPQVSVVLRPHQSSSLQWIEITEENTTGLNEENLLWAVQLHGYIFNTAPASKPQETLQNGGQEDCWVGVSPRNDREASHDTYTKPG